jgi:hypothetical protein
VELHAEPKLHIPRGYGPAHLYDIACHPLLGRSLGRQHVHLLGYPGCGSSAEDHSCCIPRAAVHSKDLARGGCHQAAQQARFHRRFDVRACKGHSIVASMSATTKKTHPMHLSMMLLDKYHQVCMRNTSISIILSGTMWPCTKCWWTGVSMKLQNRLGNVHRNYVLRTNNQTYSQERTASQASKRCCANCFKIK